MSSMLKRQSLPMRNAGMDGSSPAATARRAQNKRNLCIIVSAIRLIQPRVVRDRGQAQFGDAAGT
jgi:hypothetical protein